MTRRDRQELRDLLDQVVDLQPEQLRPFTPAVTTVAVPFLGRIGHSLIQRGKFFICLLATGLGGVKSILVQRQCMRLASIEMALRTGIWRSKLD